VASIAQGSSAAVEATLSREMRRSGEGRTYAFAQSAYTVTVQVGLPWFFTVVTVQALFADG